MDLENREESKDKMTHELIVVIVNKDFADDVMHAARKAGAGGGTVINARGTAREEDAKFFGVQIVPEKEMLMILVDSDKRMRDYFKRHLDKMAETNVERKFCVKLEENVARLIGEMEGASCGR